MVWVRTWMRASSQSTSSPSSQIFFAFSTIWARDTASPSARQEHQERPRPAVLFGRGGEGGDVARRSTLAQPGGDLPAEHALTAGRVGALAVDEGHHPVAVVRAL